MPSEYSTFLEEYKKTNSLKGQTLWIMKPVYLE